MRRIQDRHFQDWEAYATTGDYGFPRPGRIVFRCLTDEEERARTVEIDGDRSDAEARIRQLSDDELLELLDEAEVLE